MDQSCAILVRERQQFGSQPASVPSAGPNIASVLSNLAATGAGDPRTLMLIANALQQPQMNSASLMNASQMNPLMNHQLLSNPSMSSQMNSSASLGASMASQSNMLGNPAAMQSLLSSIQSGSNVSNPAMGLGYNSSQMNMMSSAAPQMSMPSSGGAASVNDILNKLKDLQKQSKPQGYSPSVSQQPQSQPSNQAMNPQQLLSLLQNIQKQ